MRIDKYLWCIRYFKTRTLATTACKKGQVTVNGIAVKPSRIIYPDDNIILRKNQIHYHITVTALPTSRVAAKWVNLYRIDTTPQSAFESVSLLKYSKDYYRKKGLGRPTKKDRRDIDDFTTENE